MNIIAIFGQMQSGKTTSANYISKSVGWPKIGFAGPVKDIYCKSFGVTREFVEKWKTNPEPPPGFALNVRQGLQKIGDGFREIKPSVWEDICFDDNPKPFIIDDGRYSNTESYRVKAEDGFNILMWRPGFENDDPNGSESIIKPVVDFFVSLSLKGFEGFTKDIIARSEARGLLSNNNPARQFDYFLINNGSVEDLEEKILKNIIPLIK